MKKERLLIGEFSILTGVSKRMLRYYDTLDLLKPYDVSADNQYRYYEASQTTQIEIINTLQSFGFTLHDIKEIVSNVIDFREFLTMLIEKKVFIREKIEQDVHRLAQIEKFIHTFEKSEKQVLKVLESEVKDKMKVYKMNDKKLMDSSYYLLKQQELIKKHSGEAYFGYVLFDLDKFMMVNEKCGYEVGDKVIDKTLELIVKHMEGYCTEGKGFYARTGGDEVALFVTAITKEELIESVRSAQRDIKSFDFNSIGCSVEVSCSAGIAWLKADSIIESFRHESQKALMAAKYQKSGDYSFIDN